MSAQPGPNLYIAHGDDDADNGHLITGEKIQWSQTKPKWSSGCSRYAIASLTVAGVLLVAAISLAYSTVARPFHQSYQCTKPRIRREWRSLNASERANYISAVQCLQDLPSELVGKGNFYDDFVYVHMHVGSESHAAASFLPWHRAYLHVWESILTERCGLTTPMPYWNWELDHQTPENSSIWSAETGFGGDGGRGLPEGPGHGRCVIDGPFANTTRLYFKGEEQPHCLGRAFTHFETGEAGKLSGTWFMPEMIGEVMRSRDYPQFEHCIEDLMHNSLHWGVKGDFAGMTSTNDPLFWLHHAQLDRLWWRWQAEDPAVRGIEYEGISFNTTVGRERSGTLDDSLGFMGLRANIKVSQVMDTQGELLCYRY